MECYNCGRGAGVACKFCERAICGRKGCGYYRRHGVIRCLNPDAFCREKQSERNVAVRVAKSLAPVNVMGQKIHWCGSPIANGKCVICDGGTFRNDYRR